MADYTNTNIQITPEVEVEPTFTNLVRINGEIVGSVETNYEASAIIDSIAALESSKLANEWTKILREDKKNKIILSSQKLGIVYNGNISPIMEIDYITIPSLNLKIPRFQSSIPKPPPQPNQKKLTENAAIIYNASLPANMPHDPVSEEYYSEDEYGDEEYGGNEYYDDEYYNYDDKEYDYYDEEAEECGISDN